MESQSESYWNQSNELGVFIIAYAPCMEDFLNERKHIYLYIYIYLLLYNMIIYLYIWSRCPSLSIFLYINACFLNCFFIAHQGMMPVTKDQQKVIAKLQVNMARVIMIKSSWKTWLLDLTENMLFFMLKMGSLYVFWLIFSTPKNRGWCLFLIKPHFTRSFGSRIPKKNETLRHLWVFESVSRSTVLEHVWWLENKTILVGNRRKGQTIRET